MQKKKVITAIFRNLTRALLSTADVGLLVFDDFLGSLECKPWLTLKSITGTPT